MITPQGAEYDRVDKGIILKVSDNIIEYKYKFDLSGIPGYGNEVFTGTSGFYREEVAKVAKKGNKIEVYIANGSLIRQVNINGKPVWWLTSEQVKEEDRKWKEEYEQKKQEEFIKNKEQMDADYEALPVVFKHRIDVFRQYCLTDFRVEYESYEIFALKEAVKISSYYLNDSPSDVHDWFAMFKDLPYEKQREYGISDQHSGNTFGIAVALAEGLLRNPDWAFQYHGALAPLVGCEDYGCVHPRRLTETGWEYPVREA